LVHRPRTLIVVSMVAGLAFVFARVLYRVVFGGGTGGATSLPSIPRVQLSGPFSHITLFGPVTLEGIGVAALSAVPFALVIIATGVLVALFDPRALVTLAPRLRVGSSLVLAVGLAVSTFPVIVQSVGRAREISRLRGSKPGVRSLVSVLELTLERALGMAVALESRGIRGNKLAVDAGPPVSLVGFSVPGRIAGALSGTIHPGARILLTGATGSGKTTLLQAIAGVLEHRGQAGSLGTLNRGAEAGDVAYLPHDSRAIFLTSRVVDDVALGLIVRGKGRDDAKSFASVALADAGLGDLADRDPSTLSSGEAALAALCVLVVTKPSLLLLDEPMSALDEVHRGVFLSLLENYSSTTDVAIVMTDHPRHGLVPSGFEAWQIGEQGLRPGRFTSTPSFPKRMPALLPEPDRVLVVQGLSVDYAERSVLNSAYLEVRRGEAVLITGVNGAGKSTLLEAIATGQSTRAPHDSQQLTKCTPQERVGTVALVPSEPSSLFLCSSVAEELAIADKVAGVPEGFTALTFDSLLPGGPEALGATHPRDLSRGQQACLAIAVQMSHKPAVVLLDEPTRGLDQAAEAAFSEVIGCVVETGTAVVIAAHHRDAGTMAASRVLRLEAGHLIEDSLKQVVA
jgi:energy-coupling factor transporter ATP-binding protein EcfA2